MAAPNLRKKKVLASSHGVLAWRVGTSELGLPGPCWLSFPLSALRSLLLLSLPLVFWFALRLVPLSLSSDKHVPVPKLAGHCSLSYKDL